MIATNLIIGRLGSGKTTAIRQLIKHKPVDENWAIIVNEFGQIGIDAALLTADNPDNLRITEIAGGCICCAAQTQLNVSITQLIRQYKPDRIIIETTGLGHAAGVIDLLRGEYLKNVIHIQSVICLIDINLFDHSYQNKSDRSPVFSDSFSQQTQLADIIVLNKMDLADGEYIDNARHYLNSFYPAKKIILPSSQGRFDIKWLSHHTDNSDNLNIATVAEHYQAESEIYEFKNLSIECFKSMTDDYLSFGYIFPASVTFNRKQSLCFINDLFNNAELSLIRLKAVLNCHRYWYGFNALEQHTEVTESSYRRDNRIELITTNRQLNTDAIRQLFLETIITF
ncbi:MAG: GTP-binding protein [Gammaproteobacteria bacterium]|nr:GTP-binding protein [Gammaproteobacteria bacterium]